MDADLIERAADVARDSRNLDGETVIIGELIDRIKVLESDDHEWYLQAKRIEKLERVYEAAKEPRKLVDEQAEDEGLWFVAETAPEAYLQMHLRRLHALIECFTAEVNDENG